MISKRQRRLAAQKELQKEVTKFQQIDLKKAKSVPKGMTSAYRNTRYVVMVYENIATTKGFATRIMVQKHDDKPITNHWSEMQKIKNEIFGEETTAVEYYPAKSNLIDDHNIYWMWIFPSGELPIPL